MFGWIIAAVTGGVAAAALRENWQNEIIENDQREQEFEARERAREARGRVIEGEVIRDLRSGASRPTRPPQRPTVMQEAPQEVPGVSAEVIRDLRAEHYRPLRGESVNLDLLEPDMEAYNHFVDAFAALWGEGAMVESETDWHGPKAELDHLPNLAKMGIPEGFYVARCLRERRAILHVTPERTLAVYERYHDGQDQPRVLAWACSHPSFKLSEFQFLETEELEQFLTGGYRQSI